MTAMTVVEKRTFASTDEHTADIKLARGGDSDALGRLLLEVEPYLRSVSNNQFSRRLCRRLSSEDVFQGGVVRVVRSIGKFQGNTIREFAAYCCTCVVSQAMQDIAFHNAAKRSFRRDVTISWDVSSTEETSESQQKETVRIVIQELANLPFEQAEAIRLHHFSELSVADTAERMGKTREATAGLIKRAKIKLRSSEKLATCF